VFIASISNLGNSQAGIVDVIDSATRIHWLEGLKLAENIIQEKQSALRANKSAIAKHQRQLVLESEKLHLYRLLNPVLGIPLLGTWIGNKVADIEDKLNSYREEEQPLKDRFRDCMMELDTAMRKRAEIIINHPEVRELSYEQIQERYSGSALREKKAFAIASTIWSVERGLPESVGQLILSSTSEEQQYLMLREMQIRGCSLLESSPDYLPENNAVRQDSWLD
jgi:hypothetical protein